MLGLISLIWQQTKSHSVEVPWHETRLSGIRIRLTNSCKGVTGAAGDTCILEATPIYFFTIRVTITVLRIEEEPKSMWKSIEQNYLQPGKRVLL